jgi:ribosomal protein S18 acetylase RimI-like enzyme
MREMIREGSRQDVRRCAEIIADSLLWRTYNRTIDDAAVSIESTFIPGSTLLVYEENGRINGFIILYERGVFCEYGYIRLIGVDSGYRGKGIGAALLTAAEERLFPINPLVFLTVTEFNTGAQRFYSRMGYEKIGEIPDYKHPGIAEYLLMKRKNRNKSR